MPATDTSSVKIVINVVDAGSGEVISRTVKNVEMLGDAGAKAGRKLVDGLGQGAATATSTAEAVEKGANAQTRAVEQSAALQKKAYREIGSAHEEMIARTSRATGAGTQSTQRSTPSSAAAFRADAIVPPKQAVGSYIEMLENIASAEGKLTAQRLGVSEAAVQGWKRAQAAWSDYERSVDRSTSVRRSSAAASQAAPARMAANPFTTASTGSGNFGTSSFTGGAVEELKKVGGAADEAGNKGEQAFKKIGGHAMTSLDNVRLLRDDLGIKIPRGMEMAISRSKALSAVIGGLGGLLVGLGSFELAFHVGKEIYDFYDKLTDVNVEMRKYAAQANENASQKLFDTQSIEEVNALLKQTNGLVAGLDQKRVSAGVGIDNSGGFMQYAKNAALQMLSSSGAAQQTSAMSVREKPKLYTADDDRQRAQLATQQDLLKERTEALAAKRAVDQQEAKASIDGARLTGYAANSAAASNAKELARLKQQQQQKEATFQRGQIIATNTLLRQQNPNANEDTLRDKGLRAVPDVAKDLGAQERADAEAKATGEAAARGTAMARKENEELTRLRGEANAAGLQGEARHRAELQTTIDGYNQRQRNGELRNAQQFIAIATERYNKEKALRIKSEQEETARIQDQAAQQGLTGLAKLDAERRTRLADLDKQKPTFSDPAAYGQHKAAIEQGSGADAAKQMDDFTERIKQMDDSRANSSMSANARIDAETRHTTAEITKAWTDLYGGLAAQDARRLQSQIALSAEIARINAAAAQQKAENTRTLEEQTRKAEDEAGRLGAPRAQEQTRAVIDDYNERIRELERLRAKDADNADLYRRQEVAAEQIKNGKLVDLQREQRDKLAGQLRGFMSNPMEALKRQGEDLASKAAADLLMGNLPGKGLGAGNKNGGIIDGARAIFRPTFGGGKRQFGAPGDDHHAAASIAPAQAIVNAGSAVINVGSASFSGGGNRAASPSSAVSAIANSGYASTGNGSSFNLGASPSSSESGSAAGVLSAGGNGIGTSGGGATLPGYTESSSDAAGRIFGNAQSGISQANSMGKDLGIFGKDANGNNAGLASKIPGIKNMSSESLGKLGGTASGLMGVYSAFEGKGGVMGGLQGALGGAQVGMQYGGLAGAAIGAVVGGVLGFIGHGARVEAQKYYFKEVMPKLQQDMLGFQAGTVQYQSAYDDFTSADSEAKARTKQMGSGAVSYYDERIHPEILKYQQRLTREQKAGRSQFGMSAAQAHNGGLLSSFGSMATSPDEGWVHAQRGEIMLNQQAAMSHADVAMMMNSGTSRSDIADYMGGGGGNQRVVSGSGSTELHFHSPDARGAFQLFMDNKHHVRAALNASYAENSGGGDA